MENINYHDFLNMCRTCMLDIDLKPIEDKIIIETLEIITDKNFKTNDELPQQICGTCLKKILDINSFIKKSRNSEENFKACLANFKNECSSATIDPGDKPVEVYVVEPPKIKEENSDVTADSKINFDNIINDMRKEFDVPPLDNDPLHVSGTDPLKSSKTVENTNSISDEIDEQTSNQATRSNRCDICDKIFTTGSSLTRHKRLHSGESSFKCDKCDEVLSESRDLLKHKRTHISVEKNQCDVCNKCFGGKAQLSRHKQTHKNKNSLGKHKRTQHSNKKTIL